MVADSSETAAWTVSIVTCNVFECWTEGARGRTSRVLRTVLKPGSRHCTPCRRRYVTVSRHNLLHLIIIHLHCLMSSVFDILMFYFNIIFEMQKDQIIGLFIN